MSEIIKKIIEAAWTGFSPKEATKMKNKNKFPKGWDEKRVKGLIDHYEQQTEDEAVVASHIEFDQF